MQLDEIIHNLGSFVVQDGFIDAGRIPKRNEPFYSTYMAQKIIAMNLNKGDLILISYIIGENNQTKLYSMQAEYRSLNISQECIFVNDKCTLNMKIYLRNIEHIELISKMSDACALPEKLHYGYAFGAGKSFLQTPDDPKSSDKIILNIIASLYMPKRDCKVISSEILIMTGSRRTMRIPTEICHADPCENWYRAGMGKAAGVCLLYSSLKDLQEVECICCLWKIVQPDGNVVYTLNLVNPTFLERDSRGDIYDVEIQNTDFSVYERNLNSPENIYMEDSYSFSEQLITDFDLVAVTTDGNKYIFIKNTMAEGGYKKVKSIVKNLYHDVLYDFYCRARYGLDRVEIYSSDEIVEPYSEYFNKPAYTQHQLDRIKVVSEHMKELIRMQTSE